jgi:hypothetical protein
MLVVVLVRGVRGGSNCRSKLLLLLLLLELPLLELLLEMLVLQMCLLLGLRGLRHRVIYCLLLQDLVSDELVPRDACAERAALSIQGLVLLLDIHWRLAAMRPHLLHLCLQLNLSSSGLRIRNSLGLSVSLRVGLSLRMSLSLSMG